MAALVVGMAVFGAVAFAGPAAAASNGSISADPADAGATSTHTVTLTAGDATAGSWNGLAIDYSGSDATFDASNVEMDHLELIRIDRGDDQSGTTGDVDVRDDVSSIDSSNNGETLVVSLGGSYELNAGDEVILVVDNVVNADADGQYEVGLDINPQSSGGEGTAMLSIGQSGDDSTDDTTTESDSDTTTESDDGSDDSDADTTTESDGSSGDSDTESTTTESGGTPGFGVGAALLALLAAGALLTRRE